MAIVDEFPYPLDKPMGQELLRVMAATYPKESDALIFVAPMGVDSLSVVPGQSPIALWAELLRHLATAGTVRDAVQKTRDTHPRSPNVPFFDALLKGESVPTSAEPLPFDDRVTEPEALLFLDDLTIATGGLPALIRTLQTLVPLVPAVCLLRVTNAHGEFYGTGFRISDESVLTNHHVLFPKNDVATRVHVEFGFDVDDQGASTAVTSLKGDVGSIIGEAEDDWGVIKVPGMAPGWPRIPLKGTPTPIVGSAAYIIQHPSGGKKRLGYVRNTISEVTDRVVRYLTDTEPGSSGSPVFDAAGHLIALHHAGGQPTEIVGKPPIAKNEGVRISRIAERLELLLRGVTHVAS